MVDPGRETLVNGTGDLMRMIGWDVVDMVEDIYCLVYIMEV